MTETNYRLACRCGWYETGSQAWLEQRAVCHGFGTEKHDWSIRDPDGEVIASGR